MKYPPSHLVFWVNKGLSVDYYFVPVMAVFIFSYVIQGLNSESLDESNTCFNCYNHYTIKNINGVILEPLYAMSDGFDIFGYHY